MKTRLKLNILLLLVAIGLLTTKTWLEPEVLTSKNTRASTLPKAYTVEDSTISNKALGFNEVIADSLWIRLLQQADHKPVGPDEVSWEFVQLEKITALSPVFSQAYDLGSIYLSSFRRDKQGALFFLKRWEKYFPNYWKPLYMLGFHYNFEMGDPKTGAEYILRAATYAKAPFWLSSMGIRMFSEKGSLLQALRMSMDLYPYMNHPEAKSRLETRIRSLNYNLQKQMWTDAIQLYQKEHKRGLATLSELPRDYTKQAFQAIGFTTLAVPKDSELRDLMKEKFSFAWDAKQNKVVSLSEEAKTLEKYGLYGPPKKKEKK